MYKKKRYELQEIAQTVVSLGKSSKFATNLTNSQLRRPKSDLVHEKTMFRISRIRPNPGLERFRIRIQAGLPD